MPSFKNPPMFIYSCSATSVRLNNSFSDQLGYDASEFVSKPLLERIHPADRPKVSQILDEGNGHVQTRFESRDDSWPMFDLRIREHDGESTILGLCRSFTRQSRASVPTLSSFDLRELESSLEAMARIVEARNAGMRCSILLVDWETERVSVGVGPSLPAEYNAAVNGLKIGPKVGSCGTASYWNVPVVVEDIYQDPLWENLRDVASIAGVGACWSQPITCSNGDVLGAMALYNDRPCAPEKHHMDGLEIAARMVGLAIERDWLEKQMREKNRMEAIGLLAGGVAHDFNNILLTIMGNVELAQAKLIDNPAVNEMLGNVFAASQRASELCNQMLGVAGKRGAASESIELNAQVQEIVNLTRVAFSKKITFCNHQTDEDLGFEGDRSQLSQVLLNLLTNASEAIGDQGGTITITTEAKYFDAIELFAIDPNANLPEGRYATIQIADTGSGICEQVKSKIFDPFFTTKESGRGLGLAAVKGIITAHGGTITMTSQVAAGTEFSLFLPQSDLAEDVGQVEEQQPVDCKKNATILLIDDDPMVGNTLKMALENSGYVVICARDGESGIELFKEKAKEISLVLLDLSMPGIDGENVYQILVEEQPDVRIILCSGYAKEEILDRFDGKKIYGVLKKPMQLRALLSAVSDAIP